jgi:hypothetical protein
MRHHTSASFALFFLLIMLMGTGCSYRIVRSGYKANKELGAACQPVITKQYFLPDSAARRVGEVRLRDSGFTTKCGEEQALAALRQEACMAGANVVKIVREQRPSFGSVCYRCEAVLYEHAPSPFLLADDPHFDAYPMGIRKERDKKRKALYSSLYVVLALTCGIAPWAVFYLLR